MASGRTRGHGARGDSHRERRAPAPQHANRHAAAVEHAEAQERVTPAITSSRDRDRERDPPHSTMAEAQSLLSGRAASKDSQAFLTMPSLATFSNNSSELDMDVVVLAFAQWVSEMKTRQNNANHQMQAEMSVIRNAITSNSTELEDFKRNSAATQRRMQNEMYEIRESLGTVFMEITTAVRNNANIDQETRAKIQGLNEQAVRNETAFAQLADAADQSQTKLRNAVQEMQLSSERMRDELVSLTRFNESMETSLSDRYNRIAVDMDQVGNDLHVQLERRKDHLKKMLNDVMLIGESLHNLVADIGDQKRSTFEVQNKLQSNLYVLDQILVPSAEDTSRGRSFRVAGAAASDLLPHPQAAPQARALTPTPVRPLSPQRDIARTAAVIAGSLPAGAMAVSASMRPMQSVIYR